MFQWQEGSWNYYNKKVFKTQFNRALWQDQVDLTARVLSRFGSADWIKCTEYIRKGNDFVKDYLSK
ncbi:MAG: hypothetical protein AABY22_05975 [Nanoarchaeota archaeon]